MLLGLGALPRLKAFVFLLPVKRFAALALAMSSLAGVAGCFAGDLRASNSVGEQILIKKSTINHRVWGMEDAKKLLAAKEGTGFRQWAQLNYRNCVSGPVPSPGSECRREYFGEEYQSRKKEIEDLEKFINADLQINYVSYVPIEIDLNGRQSPLPQVRFVCSVNQAGADGTLLAGRLSAMAGLATPLTGPPGIDLVGLGNRVCAVDS